MPEPICKYNTDFIFYFFAKKIAKHLNINPNIITYLSFVVTTIIMYTLFQKKVYLTLFLVFVRSFMDILDGTIARVHNRTSEYGKNLDIVADNYFNISLAIIYSYMLFNSSINLLIKIITFIILSYLTIDTVVKELLEVFNYKSIDYNSDILYVLMHDNTIIVYQIVFIIFFAIIL